MATEETARGSLMEQALEMGEDRQQELREQRELALACAFMSFFISLAVVLSNFGPEPAAIPAAREAVVEHRKVLASAEANLKTNEKDLNQTRAALAGVKKAIEPNKP